MSLAGVLPGFPAAPATASGTRVEAVGFESRKIYQSSQHPSYASWVSFFPGEANQWYIGCIEQQRINPPHPASTPTENYWRNGGAMPPGYDHKRNHIDMLLLESRDDLAKWRLISRWNADPIGTAAWGAFAQARTSDHKFLRFIWQAYADELDPTTGTLVGNRIFYISDNDGLTWELQRPFHDVRFFSFAHRLRTLRDGTLVLAIPFSPGYGPRHKRPTRLAWDLAADTDMQMTLYFSGDNGRNWSGPMPIYGGQAVSETDFVELPSGDLLFINWIPPRQGRQIVYRSPNGWLPGPLEKVTSGTVPETVVLTREGILVGCLRPGSYHWSDDLGKTWQPLQSVPDRRPEMYQPWMQYLSDGRIACAGHYGGDDPFGLHDQYVSLHLFRLEVSGKAAETKLSLERDFDEGKGRWKNSFTFVLRANGRPLPGQELELWYVERDKPGYDPFGKLPLEKRMQMGGHLLRLRTDESGEAHISFPQFDELSWDQHTIQIMARFNPERVNPEYKPAETFLFEFYTFVKQ